jgi:hypothetical protein
MAQHDYNIINGPGSFVRKDINDALAAILTNNSGPVAPEVKVPGTWWFDTSDTAGPGVLRVYGLDGNWHSVAAGAVYLPLAGGNIIGDLTVTGVFSNPDFNLRRKNYISATAPTTKVPGQLWYDTSTTPDSLKIWSGTAWITLVNVTSPTFTQMVDVTGVGAEIGLTAASEKRRIVNNPTANQLEFYSSTNVLVAAITDTGDFWISALGNIGSTLLGKQKSLGFTPVQQTGAAAIMVGGNPAHLWIGGVDQGAIRLGSVLPLYLFQDVGLYTRGVNQGSGLQLTGSNYAGSHVRVGGVNGLGTWRNMAGTTEVDESGFYLRVA